MLPAARKDDAFACPVHGGGCIQGPCAPLVLIEGQPAARVGDGGPCGAESVPETILRGNPLVLIGGAPAAGFLRRAMQHEAGHLVWDEIAQSQREEWQTAMDADRRAVSAYGNSAIKEDFAEAVLMYSLVKGTPCEATMKAAFPKRFALLEEIFSQRGFHTP